MRIEWIGRHLAMSLLLCTCLFALPAWSEDEPTDTPPPSGPSAEEQWRLYRATVDQSQDLVDRYAVEADKLKAMIERARQEKSTKLPEIQRKYDAFQAARTYYSSYVELDRVRSQIDELTVALFEQKKAGKKATPEQAERMSALNAKRTKLVGEQVSSRKSYEQLAAQSLRSPMEILQERIEKSDKK